MKEDSFGRKKVVSTRKFFSDLRASFFSRHIGLHSADSPNKEK